MGGRLCRDRPARYIEHGRASGEIFVEKIGESIVWVPEQEVSLSRFDDWKGEYVRIEDGEDIVDAIDRQDGWSTKRATFHAELIDLSSDSRVRNVPSKFALQIVEDDWAAQR
jgi:hypothetical protein